MRHEDDGKDGESGREITVTVTTVAFTVHMGGLHVLLVAHDGPPFPGQLALPCDVVGHSEDLEVCTIRILCQSTGVEIHQPNVRQLHAYGHPDRDPSVRAVSIAYTALIPYLNNPPDGSMWLAIGDALDERLAYDHDMMLIRALDETRTMIEETSGATALLTEEFTLAELRSVYEAIWGGAINRGNFARRASKCPGFIKNTGFVSTESPGRPASLFVVYRHGPLKTPIRRPWLVDPTIPAPPFNGSMMKRDDVIGFDESDDIEIHMRGKRS